MAKNVGMAISLSSFYFALSMVHLDLGEFESAQSYAEKALSLTQENKEKPGEGYTWIILGRIPGKRESPQMERAEECILKGIKILGDLKDKPMLSIGYLCLAELYAAAGRRLKALIDLKRAQRMFKAMGMDYWLAVSKQASRD